MVYPQLDSHEIYLGVLLYVYSVWIPSRARRQIARVISRMVFLYVAQNSHLGGKSLIQDTSQFFVLRKCGEI